MWPWLGVVGVILTVAGIIIQFVEWRISRVQDDELKTLRWYIEALDLEYEDIKETKRLPHGEIIPQVAKLNEVYDILEAGLKDANRVNRKKLVDLTDSVSEKVSRRSWMIFASWMLLAIRGLLQAGAGFYALAAAL